MFQLLDFQEYDKVVLAYSTGKDSLATILYLLSLGIEKEKIELFHQLVDGRYDEVPIMMDWPSTEGHIRKVVEHLGLKLQWQWRKYGFYGELYRQNSLTNDVYYQNDEELLIYSLPTTRGKHSTRMKWPAKTGSLKTRWCSGSLKIDVARRVINNRPDLKGNEARPYKLLFVTGERREESVQRSKYREFESHPGNTKSRIVHHWRPILDWKERDVWSIIEKNRIIPHPAYYLGFSRLSCRSCIFLSKNNWRTLSEISPDVVKNLSEVEAELKFTIDQKYSLNEIIHMGKSSITDLNRAYIRKAVEPWTDPVVTDKWELPAGAFSGNGGGSR